MKKAMMVLALMVAGMAMSAPVKSNVAGNEVGRNGAPLPYDAEVEYLESTDTQWIDTGILRGSTASLSLQLLWKDVTTRQLNGADGGFYFGVVSGYWQNGQTAYDHSTIEAQKDTWYDVNMSWEAGNKLTVDGTTILYSRSFLGSDYNFFLYALNSQPASFLCRSKIRMCKIFKAGVLVRDFIPVRFTNEQGMSEGAMYDRVTGELFRNQGAGAFIIGPDKR